MFVSADALPLGEKCRLTRRWYDRRAKTGQMTMIQRQNTIALPTPCDVPSACRRLVCDWCETRNRCSAAVQITKIAVITCAGGVAVRLRFELRGNRPRGDALGPPTRSGTH